MNHLEEAITGRFFLFLLLALYMSVCFAQPPDSLWSRTFGGSNWEECYSVQQTSDGGYIMAGYAGSFGASNYDFWLVKTDANGDSLWSRTFGGGSTDVCYSVRQTSDGGYIVGGYTDSFGTGGRDFWLVKTNADGDSLWSRTFGGNHHDLCYSVQQTSDGGYMLGGITQSFGAGGDDFWLVKTNASGDSLWSRTFGGSSGDDCFSAQETSDGGCILGGLTTSFGVGTPLYPNFWLVKTDADGDSLWSRAFGGENWDYCYSVQQTSDGGYVLAGGTYSYGAGSADSWVLKTDGNGDSLWSCTFGGNHDEWCNSVWQTWDGGYLLAGCTQSFGAGGRDFWLEKRAADGDSLWSRTFGGSNDDGCSSGLQTLDGGYVLAGYTSSFGAGSADFWLVKAAPDLAVEPITISLPIEYTLYPNWPNPFNPSTQISYELPKMSLVSLKIFNLLGQELANLVDEMQSAGTHTIPFDGSGLASGVYLCRLQAGDFATTMKMVLLK